MKTGRNWKTTVSLFAGAVVALFAGGCTMFEPVADPTRFYLFDSADYDPVSSAGENGGAVLGISRVTVARYLDSPGMPVRENGNRVVYSSFHRWAEPVEHGVVRMLAEKLREEPTVAHVVPYPVQRRPVPEIEVHVSVLRAEGVIEKGETRAVFQAAWELRRPLDEEIVASGLTEENDLPWDGEDFQELAASLSQGTASLVQQVARAVEEAR